MSFNVSKCKVMHISRKKYRENIDRLYHLGGQPLECVPHTIDLGITVTNNLSWARHIESMSAKANKTLGLLKRVCKDLTDSSTRKLLYCSLVRSQLEYGSNLWSPYTLKHRLQIENVQRRAAKFILNYPSREMSYTDRLSTISLPPLELRREFLDLVLLFKCRTGLIASDIKNFFGSSDQPFYSTRSFDSYNYRLTYKHKQDYYQNSYFIRAARLWNKLPLYIKKCNSLSTFRSELDKFYMAMLENYLPPGHK